ncbi:AEC family transporter [Nocardia sp. NPDC005978]|uniref:AEC family transporter n=1 Tax=Nocardia sp. NPDC005978 TaxID=3156725 RepID=UPI0033BB0FC7
MGGVTAMAAKLAPVVFVFAAGVVFARRGTIDAAASKLFSEFAFRFAIPAYLLGSLYAADLDRVFDPRAIGSYTLTVLLAAGVVGGICHARGIGMRGIALRIMAACQVNTAYLAIPVFALLFGDVSPIFPILLLQVCVLTTVIIALLESAPGEGIPDGATAAGRVRRGLWSALTTPLVLSCWLGIGANLTEVPVPRWMLDCLSTAGAASAPIALFALGLHLGGTGLRLRPAAPGEYWLIACKCLAFPALTWLIADAVFHVGHPWLAYLTLIAAMPTAQNLFLFAQSYDTDIDLAAATVVKSTLVSLLLLPIWAALLISG